MPAAVDVATLSRRIAGYPIVSCDVFDTALTRILARPEDVLLAVGARALARGLVSCTPEAFREYRIEAERAARQRAEAAGFDEVRIAEIYAHLVACGITAEDAALAELEIAVEHAVCRPNAALRAALNAREATQRLIFVSDSPLPGAWIAGLLRDAAYGEDCRVFSSADIRLSKHTGRLFRHVIQALNCSARDIVHIGDNPLSDIVRADEAGITALYVPRVRPPPETDRTAAADWLVRLTHSHRRANDAAKGTPTAKRTSHPRTPDGSALYRYASLLLIGFTLFVLAEARRQGIRRIYFLARDGYLPLAIAERLLHSTRDQFEIGYLHVSRRSIVLPTMIDDLQRFAEEVASNLSGRPIKLAFNCLGISSDETSRMLREIGIDPDTTADGPSALKRVRRLFDSQRELIRARLLDQRNSAISYLRQSGFLEPGRRLVVDVGWKGSTQMALSRLTGLPATDIAGCYLGLLPQAMSAELNLDKARGYLFSFGIPSRGWIWSSTATSFRSCFSPLPTAPCSTMSRTTGAWNRSMQSKKNLAAPSAAKPRLASCRVTLPGRVRRPRRHSGRGMAERARPAFGSA